MLPWPLVRGAWAAGAAQAYDDGNDAVPGGVVGDPERVIVIGAGWAGLTVANALRNAGVDHVVLEGRDRIGGRARTVELDGAPVDLGCSWIHEPVGNPMTRFAEQAGVKRTNADIELDAPLMRVRDGVLGKDVGLGDKATALAHALNFSENEASAIAKRLGPGASVRDGARAYSDAHSLRADKRRYAEFVIRLLSEIGDNAPWDTISLAYWANFDDPYNGVGEGEFPVGGYTKLIQAMAGTGEVRLGHRVLAVETTPGGVSVRAEANGEPLTITGSHAVVTVPLGVLKRDTIAFAPAALPERKRAAIARAGFGRFEKVAMLFDEPFWEAGNRTHVLYLSNHADFELPLWLDLHRISGFPALVAFAAGGFAKRISQLGPDGSLSLALTRLGEILGRDIPRPRAWQVTGWQDDPFTAGAYSTVLVGGALSDLDVLAEPTGGGRVLFAGEATSSARPGYADGAMSSGIREAKRLLRAPSVALTAG
jgi:monoamine oxidase